MDHGKRVDKNRRAGIQIIDQSRDENKRKDLDKHQAVPRRLMGVLPGISTETVRPHAGCTSCSVGGSLTACPTKLKILSKFPDLNLAEPHLTAGPLKGKRAADELVVSHVNGLLIIQFHNEMVAIHHNSVDIPVVTRFR